MISKRVRDFPFSGIREFFELVQKAEDVISLGVGEPDFPTPEHIKDAGIRAIENNHTSYTSNYGLPELRESIAAKLREQNNVEVDPETEVLITSGVSEALDLALRAIINPGDEVIIHEPSYVSYRASIWFSGGSPVEVSTREDNGFRVQPEDLRDAISDKTKALLIASPNNPTGSVLRRKDLEEISDIAVENDLLVLSDEIYEYMIYDKEKHHSIGSLNGMGDRTITLNGYSKAFSCTGWRMGYAAGRKEYIESMMKIHQYTMLCAPSIAQHALLNAFEHMDSVERMVRSYDTRRRLLVDGLNSLPDVSCIKPKGAFYAFPNITKTGFSSREFAEKLLADAGVAVVPGDTFGASGEGFVRCCYAASREDLSEALERMDSFLTKQK